MIVKKRKTMQKILIVEDDFQITKSLLINLKYSGFEAHSASSIAEAWEKIKEDHYDLMCLDVGLPDGNGIDFCQKVRDKGDEIPIIFLSARTDESTVVKGISCGGDDYIRKPFGVEELKIRINKILKKFSLPTALITFGDLTIDPVKRLVTLKEQVVTLGRKELEILVLLTKKAGEIVTRENILSTLYENADLYDRTVDSHMSHLRRKLKEIAGKDLQINSVYGMGYRLVWANTYAT
jgi:DNA-binding response OmpR family regulator